VTGDKKSPQGSAFSGQMTTETAFDSLQRTVVPARGMGLLILQWILLIGVLCSPFFSAEAANRHAPRAEALPVWQLDLKPFGFVRERSDWEATNSRIVFVSGDTLAPTWLSPNGPTGRSPTGATQSQVPHQLQALFVDAATGKVRATRAWPTGSGVGHIFAGVDGRFIVVTADKSTIYSPTFDQMLELGSHDQISVSPDGKTILTKDATDSSQYRFRWFDVGSLQVLRSWIENEYENTWKGPQDIMLRGGHMGPICDDEMVSSLPPIGFLIRRLDGPWRLVRIQGSHREPNLEFLSSQLLLNWFQGYEWQGGAKISLVRTDG
jgi:hypothetical protein